jgi:hypothetical protein
MIPLSARRMELPEEVEILTSPRENGFYFILALLQHKQTDTGYRSINMKF